MTKASNCLNLVGDCDDVALICDVEKAFGIRISAEEALQLETVGQLFETISSKLTVSEARGLGCPTALAFFRLRDALRRSGHVRRIESKTDLRTIFSGFEAKRRLASLSRATELELPPLELAPPSAVLITLTIVAGAAASLWLDSWLPLLGSTVLAVLLALVLPVAIPERISSLGDFAASCAAWNYGRLSERAGGARPHDVWKALTTIIRESSGASVEDEISSNTRFFAERRS
jgi:hypothetical protein